MVTGCVGFGEVQEIEEVKGVKAPEAEREAKEEADPSRCSG